jgi:hypothetical protein
LADGAGLQGERLGFAPQLAITGDQRRKVDARRPGDYAILPVASPRAVDASVADDETSAFKFALG